MRETKFRAYDRIHKEWWITSLPHGTFLNEIANEGDKNRELKETDLGEWQQYTGLKDKNGVEIYEGDIIFCDICDSISEVEWHNESAMFSFHRPNVHDCYKVSTGTMEVIGNAWENRELLN